MARLAYGTEFYGRDTFYEEYIQPTLAAICAKTGAMASCVAYPPDAPIIARDPIYGTPAEYASGVKHTRTYVLSIGGWTSERMPDYAIRDVLSLMATAAHLGHARGVAAGLEMCRATLPATEHRTDADVGIARHANPHADPEILAGINGIDG